MQTFNTITKKINAAPDLNFGDIINDAIELFKKVWIKGFLTILIIAVTAIAVSFVFQLIGLAPDSSFFVNNDFNLETFVGFYSQNAINSIPQTIIVSSVTIALMAAFYRICKQVSLGQNENDDYFYFFKKEYFTKALLLGMMYTAIATVTQLLLLIPYIYAILPLSYFSIVFSNNPDLREMEIVKISFAIGNKKWLISFASLFVCSILGMLGIIACGIGILLTISIAYLPFFLIYKEVIGFNEQSEIDLIGEDNDFS